MNGLIISTISNVIIFVVKDDKFNFYNLSNEDSMKSSEKLLPLIKTALEENLLEIKDLDFIAVCNGVGSFTGVRVGLTTAKIMAQVLQKNIIVFNNFEVLAKGQLKNKKFLLASASYAGGIFVFENGTISHLNKEAKEELFKSRKEIVISNFEKEYFKDANFIEVDYLTNLKAVVLDKIQKNELSDFEKVDALYVVNSQAEVELSVALKNVVVKNVENTDIGTLVQIEKECFEENVYNLKTFEDELNCPNKKYFKIIFKDKIVGFAGFSFVEGELELLKIAILPLHRGKGLSKILFDEAQKTFGYNKIFLEVNKNNFVAISLYKRLGFNQISYRKSYYSNGDDALIFEFNK